MKQIILKNTPELNIFLSRNGHPFEVVQDGWGLLIKYDIDQYPFDLGMQYAQWLPEHFYKKSLLKDNQLNWDMGVIDREVYERRIKEINAK
jgi:hypothetical protein